jgi:hypothetical protein
MLIGRLICKWDGMGWILPAVKSRLRRSGRTSDCILSTLISARLGRFLRVDSGPVHVGRRMWLTVREADRGGRKEGNEGRGERKGEGKVGTVTTTYGTEKSG